MDWAKELASAMSQPPPAVPDTLRLKGMLNIITTVLGRDTPPYEDGHRDGAWSDYDSFYKVAPSKNPNVMYPCWVSSDATEYIVWNVKEVAFTAVEKLPPELHGKLNEARAYVLTIARLEGVV